MDGAQMSRGHLLAQVLDEVGQPAQHRTLHALRGVGFTTRHLEHHAQQYPGPAR